MEKERNKIKHIVKSTILKISSSQLLAETNLGKRKAHILHKNLFNGKIVHFPLRKVYGKETTNAGVWWGKYKEDKFGEYGSGDNYWRHVFTSYGPLWHVELWNAKRYHADEKEFLWMALSHLSLPDPYAIPGVKEERCISFL